MADAQYVPPPPPASLPVRRPAETGTLAVGAAVFLAGRIFGWDADVQGAVTLLVASVPFAISRAVDWLRAR